MSNRTKVVVMPTHMWNCGGPAMVDAVALLARAAADFQAGAAGR
jgi:hypothetical protein